MSEVMGELQAIVDDARRMGYMVDTSVPLDTLDRAIAALTAQQPVGGGGVAAIGLRFGLGGLIVNTGTHEGQPAVIIDAAAQAGEVGGKAPDVPAGTLAPVRLVFPTAEQAQRVADALVNAPLRGESEAIFLLRQHQLFMIIDDDEKKQPDDMWFHENGSRYSLRERTAAVFAALATPPSAQAAEGWIGDLPAPIPASGAAIWPVNYADGWNDCLAIVESAIPKHVRNDEQAAQVEAVAPIARHEVEQFLVAYHAAVWDMAQGDVPDYEYAGRDLAKAFLDRFGEPT